MAERIHPKTTPRNEQEPLHPPAPAAVGTYVNEQAATRAPAAVNPTVLSAAASVSAATRCFSSSSSWLSPPASSTSSSVPKPPTTPSTTRSASTTREAARWRSTTRTSAYVTASGLSFTSRATMSRFSKRRWKDHPSSWPALCVKTWLLIRGVARRCLEKNEAEFTLWSDGRWWRWRKRWQR